MRIPVVLALAAMVAGGGPALAEDPTNTTATYGAWVVHCSRQKDNTFCEMLQTLAAGEERKVVAQVAIGRLPKAKAPRAVIQVPLGVDLTKKPSLLMGEQAKYEGTYITCLERFCRADIELPTTALDEIAKAKKASIAFTLLGGKKIAVPVTTDGMANALQQALKATR